MRPLSSASAAVMLAVALALTGCGDSGDSAQKSAQATVCSARDDISKQVDGLKGLTPATVTKDEVKKSLDAIKSDLNDIRGARADLSGDRRSEAEAATKDFTASLRDISGQLLTSLSVSDAKSAVTAAADQLAASFKTAFEPISCG
jgi:uncharacterized lipoprotein YehR (DUF1307 family)